MFGITNYWRNGKTSILIWSLSAIIFLVVFQMALLNHKPTNSVNSISSWEQRARLYDKMSRDLDEHGAVFLQGGETSQSLSLSDVFSVKDGVVTPVHKAANPPVRANVLYLSPEFAIPISQAVRDIFGPFFDGAIWFQNSSLYHFSMFHASHHVVGVPAMEGEVEAEANSVKVVAEGLCPLNIILDRVVLTSTGVLLGCWQVTSGTDPIAIRANLRKVFPRAPEKQLYNPAMLHTSFARIFGSPKVSFEEHGKQFDQLFVFHELVKRLNNQIQGNRAMVSELWYVEEFDVLALALDGRMKTRKYRLGCSKT